MVQSMQMVTKYGRLVETFLFRLTSLIFIKDMQAQDSIDNGDDDDTRDGDNGLGGECDVELTFYIFNKI
jgi:hypothetical protein